MDIELPRMQPCEAPGPEIRSSLWMSHVPRGRTSSRRSAAPWVANEVFYADRRCGHCALASSL